MNRLLLSACVVVAMASGCQCGNAVPDCGGQPCTDGGGGTGGGDVGGGTGGGTAGGTGGGTGGGVAGGTGGSGGGVAGGTGGGGDDGGAGGTGGGTAGGAAGGTGGGTAGGAAGGTAGGAAGGTGGGTADGGFDVCADLAVRKCDFFVRCRADVNDPLSNGRANDQVAIGQAGNCEAHDHARAECSVAQTSLADGRMVLDMTKYLACVNAAYPTGTCARDPNDVATRCGLPQYLGPDAGPGELCTTDLECRGGYCAVPNGGVCGTCQGYLNADGGICSRDGMCDPATSYCVGADGTNPQNQPCQAFTGVDAGCNQTLTQGAQQEQCGPGNVCAGTLGNFRCIVGKAEGAACVKGQFECLRQGRGRYNLICATMGPSTDQCVKQFNTTAGGVCNTGENWPGLGNEGPYCLESEYCSGGLCTTRRALNAPCTTTDQCAGGLRCSGNFCVPFKDLNDACTGSGECKSMLVCTSGLLPATLCLPQYSALGGPCTNQNNQYPRCAEGYCDGAGGNAGVCQALKADGATCTAANQCQSAACNATCGIACWR